MQKFRLSAEARQSLNVFGASSLNKYELGKSLLFVGQFGLPSGKAEEKVGEVLFFQIRSKIKYERNFDQIGSLSDYQ